MTRAWIVVWFVGAVFVAGCASSQYLPVKRAQAIGSCQTAVPERDTLVGVALSGGGSRAAIFGAAGLEALAGVRMPDGSSLIDSIAHISSVSGGSLAATYYALKKPGRGVKVLNGNGTLSDPYQEFFAQYQTDISQDFETPLIWRQLLHLRWLNSALAARTLAEILKERLYGDTRLQDLAVREKAGDSPGLIVNTTLYNNGRRLAMTSLPPEAFEYDFFADLDRSLRERGRVVEPAPIMHERWTRLRPLTPIEIGIDPCLAGLNGIAAASASFPPLIGPITLRVGQEETYWMPTFTFERRPSSVRAPGVDDTSSRASADGDTSSRCFSTWFRRSPSTSSNASVATGTESGCATHVPSKPASASRCLSSRTAAKAFLFASSSVRDGITAAMPPIACAPRAWQVFTTRSL